MKKVLIFLLLAVFFVACSNSSNGNNPQPQPTPPVPEPEIYEITEDGVKEKVTIIKNGDQITSILVEASKGAVNANITLTFDYSSELTKVTVTQEGVEDEVINNAERVDDIIAKANEEAFLPILTAEYHYHVELQELVPPTSEDVTYFRDRLNKGRVDNFTSVASNDYSQIQSYYTVFYSEDGTANKIHVVETNEEGRLEEDITDPWLINALLYNIDHHLSITNPFIISSYEAKSEDQKITETVKVERLGEIIDAIVVNIESEGSTNPEISLNFDYTVESSPKISVHQRSVEEEVIDNQTRVNDIIAKANNSAFLPILTGEYYYSVAGSEARQDTNYTRNRLKGGRIDNFTVTLTKLATGETSMEIEGTFTYGEDGTPSNLHLHTVDKGTPSDQDITDSETINDYIGILNDHGSFF